MQTWISTGKRAGGLLVLLLATAGVMAAELARPTVLITGSSRGIGYELTRQYAEQGWGVIATARNPAGANELQALAKEHPNIVVEELDVTDFEEIDAVADGSVDPENNVLRNAPQQAADSFVVPRVVEP